MNTERSLNPQARIYNLGFGAAKDIKLRWDFSIDSLLQFVKDYFYRNSIPIVVGTDPATGMLQASMADGWQVIIGPGAGRAVEHSYLLPVSVDSTGHGIHIPEEGKTAVTVFVTRS